MLDKEGQLSYLPSKFRHDVFSVKLWGGNSSVLCSSALGLGYFASKIDGDIIKYFL